MVNLRGLVRVRNSLGQVRPLLFHHKAPPALFVFVTHFH